MQAGFICETEMTQLIRSHLYGEQLHFKDTNITYVLCTVSFQKLMVTLIGRCNTRERAAFLGLAPSSSTAFIAVDVGEGGRGF